MSTQKRQSFLRNILSQTKINDLKHLASEYGILAPDNLCKPDLVEIIVEGINRGVEEGLLNEWNI